MAPASEEAEHFRADAGRLRGIARSCASFRVMAGAPAGPGCASGVCGGCAIEPECGSGGVSRKRRVGERMIGKRTPGIMRRAASTSPARLSRCSLRLGILGLVSCFGAGRFLESVKAPGRTAPPVPDREMQKTDRRGERRARRERSRRHSREASASGGFRNRAKAYRMTTFDGCNDGEYFGPAWGGAMNTLEDMVNDYSNLTGEEQGIFMAALSDYVRASPARRTEMVAMWRRATQEGSSQALPAGRSE